MMILGKKVGMTQIYDDGGKIMPVTVILAGPCTITQVKTQQTDGYQAIQLGFDEIKKSRQTKAQQGHSKKANDVPRRFMREFRLDGQSGEYKQGDKITVEALSKVKTVDVVGTSKGKGFQGVMKRHGFGGMPASHGTERKHRSPGSIASHATNRGHCGHPKKGKRMAGHMGDVRVTSKNHTLVSVDVEKNLLVVKGSVPGVTGGYVIVKESKGSK